jgi:hypothetical protein
VYTASKYLAFTRGIIVVVIIVIFVIIIIIIRIVVVVVVVVKLVLFCLDTFRHCKFGWFATDRELVPAF